MSVTSVRKTNSSEVPFHIQEVKGSRMWGHEAQWQWCCKTRAAQRKQKTPAFITLCKLHKWLNALTLWRRASALKKHIHAEVCSEHTKALKRCLHNRHFQYCPLLTCKFPPHLWLQRLSSLRQPWVDLNSSRTHVDPASYYAILIIKHNLSKK